jgi:hypothetical protein
VFDRVCVRNIRQNEPGLYDVGLLAATLLFYGSVVLLLTWL